MASRGGRGRGGWRGGRSGGRAQGAPGLKDDEGNFVPAEVNAGPPSLFPEIELRCEPPEPSAHDKLLLLRRDDLIRCYKYSPYHIEPRPDKMAKASAAAAAGDTDDQERDRLARKSIAAQQKPPLASLLTLHPHHFPEELYTDKDRRLAARSTRDTEVFRRTPAAEDGEAAQELKKRLEQLNRQEQQRGGPGGKEGGGAAAGGAKKGAGEGEAAAEEEDPNAAATVVGFDDDDDDVMEEDDYYQGEVYDDDEGYDDYDDAGDEGAVY